jgi:hypothetical protein
MFEFTRNLISNNWYVILSVLILWLFFHYLFVKYFKIKEIIWIRLEYIWISIGFIGVLTIVEENQKNFNQQELRFVENWIDYDYEELLSISNLQINCIKYEHNPSLYTKEEYDLLQLRQDSICNWTNKIHIMADSCFKQKKSAIINLPKFKISNEERQYPCDRIKELISNINKNVKKRESIKPKVRSRFWNDIKSGFGVILLIIAFALRLTITSNKVNKEKNKA